MEKTRHMRAEKQDGIERIYNAAFLALFYANELKSGLKRFRRGHVFKSVLFIIILSAVSISALAVPSVQRSRWWQMRIDSLKEQKEQISGKQWSGWAVPLIEENIELSREMFSRYDSVFSEKLSPEMLEKQNLALFHAAYLDHFLVGYCSDGYQKEFTHEVNTLIKNEISTVFSTDDENFIDEVYRMTVTDRDHKNISYQHYIIQHSGQLERISESAPSGGNDAGVTLSAYKEYINNNFTLAYGPISGTAAFRELSFRLSRLKKKYDAVHSLYNSAGNDTRYLVFTVRPDLLQQDFLPEKNDLSRNEKLFRTSAARLRAAYTPKLGTENDPEIIAEYNRTLGSNLRAVIDKYSPDDTEISRMNAAAERENQYIGCISQIKQNDASEALRVIGENYDTAAVMRNYLTSLYEKATEFPNGADGALNKKILTETANHLRFITQSAAPCSELRTVLYGAALTGYSRLREEDSTHLSETLNSVSAASRNHAVKSAELKVKDRNVLDRNEVLLAQSEINHLEKAVEREIAVLESLDLFSEFLREYSEAYTVIEKEVSSKRLSSSAKDSFSSGTLIPRLPGADISKISGQIEARTFIKKMIADDIARLASLSETYRRMNLPLSYFPDQGDLWLKRKKLDEPQSVQIGSWQMNEQNFQLIDRKAVALLKTRYERSTYSESPVEADSTHEIEEYGLSFSVPEGWEMKGTSRNREGNLMNFENTLDGSMLMIGGYQPSRTESEIIDEWIREHNLKIVKTGYAEKGSTLYLWKIASDGGNNVAKICAIHQDGKIILVAGYAPKERYPFFQKRIDAVFDSIR